MSLADRFRRWFRGAPEAGAPGTGAPGSSDGGADGAPAREGAPGAAPREQPAPAPPPSVLDGMASGAVAPHDGTAVEAFEELARTLGESAAIAHARRALAAAPLPGLRVRVARVLDARGDDDAVESLLSHMPEGPEIGEALLLEAWMRRAEVAERRGDADAARSLYERVLARDVTYPRARERVAQLRAGLAAGPRDGGATVMAEGALTRGRYRVVRELGRGGAGTVFLAEDVSLGRQVALKVYHRRGRADRERLIHEARMPAELEHPGVVRILDVDLELFAIAMEVTEGSVKDAARGGLSPERALGWARSIASTLGWLHARGVVHRDLKPSNFLLRRGDRVVLTDFGLATRLGASSAGPAGEGTSGYMPPEQRRGEPATAAMDVHALGVSLDEMLGWSSWPAAARPEDLSRAIAAMRSPEPRDRPPLDAVRALLERIG